MTAGFRLSGLAALLSLTAGCASMGKLGYTPLMNAAAVGDVPTLERLLEEGASIDARAKDGSTALMRASVGGHLGVVDRLLTQGADPTVTAKNGWTAMRYAIAISNQSIVARLRSPSTPLAEQGAEGASNDEPYRIGETEAISTPAVVRQVTPRFTDDAIAQKIKGRVVVEAIVKKDGTTEPVRIIRSLAIDLDLRAIEAARQWRFAPARHKGEPVDVLVDIVIVFNIL